MEIVLKLPVARFIKRKIGFRFSLLAYYKLKEILGIDLDDAGDVDQEEWYKGLMYTAALAYYVESEGYIPKWLKPEMGEYWYNRMTLKQGALFNEAIARSQSESKEKSKKK